MQFVVCCCGWMSLMCNYRRVSIRIISLYPMFLSRYCSRHARTWQLYILAGIIVGLAFFSLEDNHYRDDESIPYVMRASLYNEKKKRYNDVFFERDTHNHHERSILLVVGFHKNCLHKYLICNEKKKIVRNTRVLRSHLAYILSANLSSTNEVIMHVYVSFVFTNAFHSKRERFLQNIYSACERAFSLRSENFFFSFKKHSLKQKGLSSNSIG